MDRLSFDTKSLILDHVFKAKDRPSMASLMRVTGEMRSLVSGRITKAVVTSASDDLSGFPRLAVLGHLVLDLVGRPGAANASSASNASTASEAASWLERMGNAGGRGTLLTAVRRFRAVFYGAPWRPDDLTALLLGLKAACPSCKHLELVDHGRLAVYGDDPPPAFFAAIGELHPWLESLELRRPCNRRALSGVEAAHLPAGLRVLRLQGHRASSEAMQHLVRMPALTELALKGLALQDGVTIESEGWRLEKLTLHETAMGLDDVLAFSHWPQGVLLETKRSFHASFVLPTAFSHWSRTAAAAARLAQWEWSDRSACISIVGGDYTDLSETRIHQARLIEAIAPMLRTRVDELFLEGWDLSGTEVGALMRPDGRADGGPTALAVSDCVLRPSAWPALARSPSLSHLILDLDETGPATVERGKAFLAAVTRPFELSLPGLEFKDAARRRMGRFVTALNKLKRSLGVPEVVVNTAW